MSQHGSISPERAKKPQCLLWPSIISDMPLLLPYSTGHINNDIMKGLYRSWVPGGRYHCELREGNQRKSKLMSEAEVGRISGAEHPRVGSDSEKEWKNSAQISPRGSGCIAAWPCTIPQFWIHIGLALFEFPWARVHRSHSIRKHQGETQKDHSWEVVLSKPWSKGYSRPILKELKIKLERIELTQKKLNCLPEQSF